MPACVINYGLLFMLSATRKDDNTGGSRSRPANIDCLFVELSANRPVLHCSVSQRYSMVAYLLCTRCRATTSGTVLSRTLLLLLFSLLQQTTSTNAGNGVASANGTERTKKKPLPKKRTKAQQPATTTINSTSSPGKTSAAKRKGPAVPAVSNTSGSPRKAKQKRAADASEKTTSTTTTGDESQTDANQTGDDVVAMGRRKANDVDSTSDVVAVASETIVSRKRMASLNASAFMAATYEAEQTLDRNLSATESSSESDEEEEEDEEDEDNKSQNTDTDAKSQQSGVSKAKSSRSNVTTSSSMARKGAKKVKKEAIGEDAKNVSGKIFIVFERKCINIRIWCAIN